MNYTEIEGKVREATNDDPWGPTGPLMQELAHATFSYETFPEVMSMLWKRMLQDNKTNWRRTYKSLLLLNYLVRNGSERVVTSSREHIYDLRSLENYTFTDEGGKDQGINVRHKVRELIDFIQDDDRLREERKKAKKNKDKYIGMSSDAMGSRSSSGYGGYSGGSGGGSGGYNDSDFRSNHRGDNWYSDKSSADRYEDEDTQYDGEREGSDSDSPSPRRNYRYNDRASPAEMATENAKSSNLNMNIRAKAVSSPVSKQPTANAKPTMKQQQKINLGAAANFGKQSDAAAAAGIHSPTHRDSPSGNNTSVDLMDNASPNKQHNNSSSNNNNNELLDDLFKTCASVKGEQTLNSAALNDDDDDFNPRAADAPSSQEFGDFSTAFGAAAAPPPSTGLPRAPSNDEFADFTAFQGASTTTQLDAQLLSTATPANDAFDLFASSAPAVTPTPAATSTATDLLAGLGDLSIHQSMPMAAGSQPASASTLTSPPTAAALESLNEAIAQLRSLEQVQSGAQTQLVDNALKQLLLANALPGYVTPQQLLGSDSEQTDWSPLITNGNYAQLLAQLGRLFNQQCPRPEQDRTLLNIYKLDYNLDYIQLAIESLQLQLKRVPITASSMLAALLQDERLLAISLLHMCRQRGVLVQRFAATIKLLPEPQLEQLDAQFGEYLQLLCALPSQVGNALERQLPLLFAPAAYGQLLLQQWLKALHFVLQFDALQQSYDASPFSWLLERVLSQFFDAKLLQQLLQVLQHYALDGNKRPYVQLILRNLKPAACLKLAQTALQAELNLLLLLGAEALQLPHWSHCLLQQLPLQRAPVDIAALCSLVSYLNAVAPAKLRLLFEQLLGIWSKRLTLQKLNQQEHLAMCKLLILSAKCCKELELEQKRQLHQALGHHLQSPDAVQRYMGMKCVELIYNMLEPEKRLSFDYAAMERQQLLQQLEQLASFKYPSVDQLLSPPAQAELLEQHLALFMQSEQQQQQTQSTEQQLEASLDSDDDSSPMPSLSTAAMDDLDEDDLPAYDMSNDVPSHMEQRPKFLQDLLHTLRSKVENYQIFEAALSTAEQLIRSQLSLQDVQLALELLQVFLTLEMQFYYEHFERTQFQCCVAICVAQPGACGELLTREFHTDNSRYSANVRILILQVLAAAAKHLADPSQDNNPAEQQDIAPPAAKQPRKFVLISDESAAAARLEQAQRMIKARLLAKTKRYHGKVAAVKAQANAFHAVAGIFFFGLVRGQRTRQMLYVKYECISHDIDTQLLLNMLHTLATFITCAQNCPLLPAMSREIFDLCSFVRFHAEAKVRAATLQLLGIALVTMPAELLALHFADALNELQRWLQEITRSPLVGGESSDDCRELAQQLMDICYQQLNAV
ncbi:uncharacterized protein LOC108603056 isoform X2 [Drosophila busckii]|nr:uncharacterized protein LOC108603056 isoform X2 [Drosophila busckii]XP_017846981.1 uncharacterized protein LOC108603056 isoform X2 [Drosophila busckii]